ncbi:MAG: hypothetical protein AB3A66_30005 (plasmid) [Nodularia sp. CChRGM 3473]
MPAYSYLDREDLSSEYQSALPMGIRRRNRALETSTLALMGLNGTLMLLEMSLHGLILGGLLISAAAIVLFQEQVTDFIAKVDKKQRKYKVNIYAILFCFLSFAFVLDFSTAPASAQFFNTAENWITTTGFNGALNANTTATVVGIFNILRILFLLYIAVSVVNVIQAVRRDEDWASASRTPLIILTGVFAADFLTTLIIS